MKVISPFGPKIAKLKFSNKLIKKINNEVDKILNKKSLLKKLDYSKKLVGQVKQEFQLPKSFVKKKFDLLVKRGTKIKIKVPIWNLTGWGQRREEDVRNIILHKYEDEDGNIIDYKDTDGDTFFYRDLEAR